MSPSRRSVALRGVLAAAVATLAAALGHAAGQHALPSAWVVAVAFALSAPMCVALAGRRLSLVRLSAAVALSQLAFHVLLRLDFSGAGGAVGGGHHGVIALPTVAAMPSHDLDPGMGIGHLAAAIVTVAVLTTAERTVRALVDLVRRPFRALAAVGLAPVAVPAAIASALGIRPALARAGAVRRRGPPVLV